MHGAPVVNRRSQRDIEAPEPAFRRYQRAFTRHIRDPRNVSRPPGVEARRMKVYNELLYNNVESFLLACFPVTRKLLGKHKWRRLVREFFAVHRCRSPLFRQIPDEFLRYLETERGESPEDPRVLKYLAHYEWVELALDVSDAGTDPKAVDEKGDLLDGRPALNPVHMLLSYPYPVHRISSSFLPEVEETTYILAFRNFDYVVRFDVLNPVSARLLQLLEPGDLAGSEAIAKIAAELSHPKPEVVLQGGREVLRRLRQEGAVLGVWQRV
jgi:uncharacterized protein